MDIQVVNLEKKFGLIKDLHSYKVVAQMNDYYFKLVKAKREFVWHQHPETDEVFMVLKGTLTIELRDKTLTLNKNELVVIPKGVEHKPTCTQECHVMLIEPKTTLNTGNTQLIQTDDDEFISKAVKTVEEACKLIEAGYEYVTEFPEEGVKIFRKRK